MATACLSPRPLGGSGIVVSALSLGSWRTLERVPPDTGIAVLRAAREEGITFFDDARYNDETGTAPIPSGYSEVLFGELLRAGGMERDEIVLANKLWWEFWPEQSAAAELEASLRRLGFDHVDLIYATPPPAGLAVADLVVQVGGLIATGRARAWGVVNWSADLCGEAAAAAAQLGVPAPCVAQLPYSVVRRSPVEDPGMMAALRACGAGVVASFCLEGGVLTGKYRADPQAGRAAGELSEPWVGQALAAGDELAGLATRLRTTAAALALAFPLANPAVTSVLFGATSPEQVRANCAAVALAGRLGADGLALLRSIGAPARLGQR